MRFLKIILSVFALFYRLTPNYLIISDVYFLHRQLNFLLLRAICLKLLNRHNEWLSLHSLNSKKIEYSDNCLEHLFYSGETELLNLFCLIKWSISNE